MLKAEGLWKLLKALNVNVPDKLRHRSFMFNLEANLEKKAILREIEKREQEIKDYKTKQRSRSLL